MTFQDITRYIPLPLQTEFIRLVDRFFTPFAIAMVATAVTLGYAEKPTQRWAMGIVLSLAAFNQVSLYLIRKRSAWTLPIGYTRLAANFLANIVLVYLLGTFWGPMWLLFALTPIATALYADWKMTITTAVVSSGSLLAIYYSRGLEGSVGWGMASLHAAFIVFVSLFVNSIARLIMQMKSQGPAARPAPKATAQPAPATSDTPSRLAA
jgi:hypothetical protein